MFDSLLTRYVRVSVVATSVCNDDRHMARVIAVALETAAKEEHTRQGYSPPRAEYNYIVKDPCRAWDAITRVEIERPLTHVRVVTRWRSRTWRFFKPWWEWI